MRGFSLAALALLAATQGGEAWARNAQRSSGGGHVHHSPRVVVAPRPVYYYPRPVRVVPRYVYVVPYVRYVPYVPYVAAPYYPPSPAYYPATPPAPVTYIEQPQEYAPLPPAQPMATPTGPYSVEQGVQYRYFCPDTRRYYPDAKECASGWLTVLPGGGRPPQ